MSDEPRFPTCRACGTLLYRFGFTTWRCLGSGCWEYNQPCDANGRPKRYAGAPS